MRAKIEQMKKKGQGLVEYALILVLIAIVVILILT
ncbi:MAG: Flp family type IVb pilin, partial [Chloroflexota bacterium]|nr:Flp family type IVb pilin [Chloroflexota bacterium]